METANFKFTMDMATMVARPNDRLLRDSPKRCLVSYRERTRAEGEHNTRRPQGPPTMHPRAGTSMRAGLQRRGCCEAPSGDPRLQAEGTVPHRVPFPATRSPRGLATPGTKWGPRAEVLPLGASVPFP